MRFWVITALFFSSCSLFEPALCESDDDCRDFEFCLVQTNRCIEGARTNEGEGEGEGEVGDFVCSEECYFSDDSECDDGGIGSRGNDCGYGTDCLDCGFRPSLVGGESEVFLYGTLEEGQELGVISPVSSAQGEEQPRGGFPTLGFNRPQIGLDGAVYFSYQQNVYRHSPDEISYSDEPLLYPEAPLDNDVVMRGPCSDPFDSLPFAQGPNDDFVIRCEERTTDVDDSNISDECFRPLRFSADGRLMCKNSDNLLLVRNAVNDGFYEAGIELTSIFAARFHKNGIWVVGLIDNRAVLDDYDFNAGDHISRTRLADPGQIDWERSAIGPDGSVYAMSLDHSVYRFFGEELSVVFEQSLSARIHGVNLVY